MKKLNHNRKEETWDNTKLKYEKMNKKNNQASKLRAEVRAKTLV